MADIEKTEFTFPDEKEVEVEKKPHPKDVEKTEKAELEIEVADDTPEEDRDRKPMEEPPKDVTEDELSQYTEGVKKRIQHFSKGYHEERRAKEAATRERDEALRLAESIVEENKRLKGSLSQGQNALLDQAKKVVASEVDAAERKYKAAYEAGDADALLVAQRELTQAQIRADRVNNFKPAPLQPPKDEVQQQPQPAKAQPEQELHPKTKAWFDANPWYRKDREMTAVAYAKHLELVEAGVDPTSDEYFGKITARVKQLFPDAFPSEKENKKPTVVAPATRSAAPRKVVLTKTQVELAKRLNVPLELYAKKVAEQMRNDNV